MPGADGDGSYPSARQAEELERLSRQLDDLRRASGRPPTAPGRRSAQPSRQGESADTIELAAARQARRSATRSTARSSTGVGPSKAEARPGRRPQSPQTQRRQAPGGDLAAVLPFRRPAEAEPPPAVGRRAAGTRSPAEREARKAAARVAAAEAFAAALEADPEEAARELCLGWLAVRPHTRAELAVKLRRKGVPAEARDTVLDRYGEVGLIDDAAFANAYVDSRHRGRGLAKRALAFELRSRGIDGVTIDAAVGRLEDGAEEATARALVTRKLAGMGHVAPEARARRLMGMLARKGYPGGLAAQVVREVIAGSGVEIPDPDHS